MTLDQRLAEAATHVAGQVDPPEVDLGLVRAQARANHRRTVALAVAAALVAVGLAGIPLLAAGRGSAAPQPAVSPRSGIIKALRATDCATQHCLRPGTYGIGLGLNSGRSLRATLTVSTGGWDAFRWDHQIARIDDAGTVVLGVYQPFGLAGPEPCATEGATRRLAPGATIDDFAALLSTIPRFAVVDGPREVSAFGQDARYLKVRADPLSCPADAGPDRWYNLAHIYGGEGAEPDGSVDIRPGRPVVIEFWVLQVGLKPVIVEARLEGRPDDAMVEELDRVRESITFGPRQ